MSDTKENNVEELVVFSIENRVAKLVLNRQEKLNAMTPAMSDRIASLADRCNDDPEVRAVIVTGVGRAFCCGSDIRELDTYISPWAARMKREYCLAIAAINKPTIAAVNGLAMGGGLETALSCDIRIATGNARFAAPEIKLGWIGGGGMAVYLRAAIGPSRAARMLYTGDLIDAETALRWGLVDELYDDAEALMNAAETLADTIAARAPIAAQAAKLNLNAAASMPLDKAVAYERELRTVCFATEDAAEGKAAFREKRAAVFHGI